VPGDTAGTGESNISQQPKILVTTSSQRKVFNSLVVSSLTLEENIDANKNYWEAHDSSPTNVAGKTFGITSANTSQPQIIEASQEFSRSRSPDVDLHSRNERYASMDRPGHGQSIESLTNMHTAGADTLNPANLLL
jgi:hypothetical protein